MDNYVKTYRLKFNITYKTFKFLYKYTHNTWLNIIIEKEHHNYLKINSLSSFLENIEYIFSIVGFMKLNFQIIMKNVSKLKVLDSEQYSVLDDFTGEVFKPKIQLFAQFLMIIS